MTRQDWSKLSGAEAHQLIIRQSDDWEEAGQMMEEFAAARNVPLAARVAELERDAKRYQWLRTDRPESAIPRVWSSNASAEPVKCIHEEDLDSAIDAALLAKGE